MTASSVALPFRTIFHPTDCTDDSHTALLHALKLAIAAKAELSIMHIGPGVSRSDFEDFPRIRPILEQWHLLAPGSTKEQVAQLGVSIRKTRAAAKNPTQGCLHYLASHPADLLVMATHQYDGLARWQHQTVAEPVARRSHVPTLFVPTHVEGFVTKETGQSRLRRVLVPVSAKPDPQMAVDMTTSLGLALGADNLTGILVHVGDDST